MAGGFPALSLRHGSLVFGIKCAGVLTIPGFDGEQMGYEGMGVLVCIDGLRGSEDPWEVSLYACGEAKFEKRSG